VFGSLRPPNHSDKLRTPRCSPKGKHATPQAARGGFVSFIQLFDGRPQYIATYQGPYRPIVPHRKHVRANAGSTQVRMRHPRPRVGFQIVKAAPVPNVQAPMATRQTSGMKKGSPQRFRSDSSDAARKKVPIWNDTRAPMTTIRAARGKCAKRRPLGHSARSTVGTATAPKGRNSRRSPTAPFLRHEVRRTLKLSCRQKWRALCGCKGRDTFDCQLQRRVRRQHAGLNAQRFDHFTAPPMLSIEDPEAP